MIIPSETFILVTLTCQYRQQNSMHKCLVRILSIHRVFKQKAKKLYSGQILEFTLLLDRVTHLSLLFFCKVIKLYKNPWDSRGLRLKHFCHLSSMRIIGTQIVVVRLSLLSFQAFINQQILCFQTLHSTNVSAHYIGLEDSLYF